MRARWKWLAAAAVLLLAGAGAAVLLLATREPGDVSHPDVEFTAPETTAQAPPKAPEAEGASAFDWPVYGYDAARTHYLPLGRPLRPPFAPRWSVTGSTLLEFSPVMGGRALFLLKNNGALYGISRKTGKVRWKRKLGYLAASSPAYAHGTVYVVLLARGKGVKQGRVVAVNAADGRTRWSRKLPSRAESSPLIASGTLYFGSEDGTVYALRARDGFVRWRARAKGAVKGGLALADGRLFAGDYGGKFSAWRASDGRLLWRTGASSRAFGLRVGNFYSTPAAAYGRVYVGNTDGFVYSFAQSSGKLAWRRKTGSYVYASPAVASVPGGAPTVYIGSYDKRLYALDARSGRPRWIRRAEGRISGGATVLGDLVFYSTLSKTTTAVGARTGGFVWRTHRGAFNPVVSNGRGLFLNGQTSLFGLDARPPRKGQTVRQTRAHARAVARRVRARKRRVARRVARRRRAEARHRRYVGRRAARRRQAVARHRRAVARRVAARRRAVHRRNALIRSGGRICTRRGCRRPRPLVCVRRRDGVTVCRARRR